MIRTYFDNLMGSDEMTIRLLSSFNPETEVDTSIYKEILRFPMNESVSVSVVHGYEGFESGPASILTKISAALNEGMIRYKNTMEQQIPSLINLISQFTNKIKEVQSSGVIQQATSFSDFYKSWVGTDVNIPLTFNTRIYNYYDIYGIPKTTDEQIKNLMNYFIGKQKGNISTGGFMIKAVSSGAGFNYSAPNGFKEGANSFTGEMTQNGFAVCFGNKYTLTRLLLTNFNIAPSKERVLFNGQITTMFYNLSFMLMPIYLFSLLDILNLFGSGSIYPWMVSSQKGFNSKSYSSKLQQLAEKHAGDNQEWDPTE